MVTLQQDDLLLLFYFVMTDSKAELSSSKHQNSRNNGADDSFDSALYFVIIDLPSSTANKHLRVTIPRWLNSI